MLDKHDRLRRNFVSNLENPAFVQNQRQLLDKARSLESTAAKRKRDLAERVTAMNSTITLQDGDLYQDLFDD